MKRWYGIGTFIGTVAVIIGLNFAFSYTYNQYQKKISSYPEEHATSTQSKETVTNYVTNGFYLTFQDNYVIVYLSDKKTVYENTEIEYQDLPENLRQEIEQGKYIKTEEELYSFLENYSS